MQISELTEGEKKDIHRHYMQEHRELIEGLTRTATGMLKQNDRLGLLWLAETVSIIFKTIENEIPDTTIDNDFPTVGGIQ